MTIAAILTVTISLTLVGAALLLKQGAANAADSGRAAVEPQRQDREEGSGGAAERRGGGPAQAGVMAGR